MTVGEGATVHVQLAFGPAAAPGETPPPPPPLPPQRSTSPLVIAGFTVGGIGIVAGAITGGLSWSKTSQLSSICTNKLCPAGSLSTPTTLADVSDASFAVGVAGVGLGVVGLVLSRGSDPPPRATGVALRPLIGPGTVGLAGRF
jgi:hypothetical protein